MASLSANAMDKTHEDNFTMPERDKKDTVSDKAGQVILGAALVAGVVGSAILVPLIAAHKL